MVAESLPPTAWTACCGDLGRGLRFPDSPLGGFLPSGLPPIVSGKGLSLPPSRPSSEVIHPRLSFEKNRANSLVRLNANKHYQRFLWSCAHPVLLPVWAVSAKTFVIHEDFAIRSVERRR